MYLTFDHETSAAPIRHEGVPNYRTMSDTVGGLIEPVDLWEDERGRVSVWVNEEGLSLGLPTTFHVTNPLYYGPEGWTGFGSFIVTRTDMEGETVAMTQEDIDRIRFGRRYGFLRDGTPIPFMEIL